MFDCNKAMNDCLYSDLHKDVYGFRPHSKTFASQAELDEDVEYLCRRLDEKIEEDRAEEADAMIRFDARLAEIQKLVVNADEQTAFRLLLQAEDLERDFDWYGAELAEHHFGLRYGSLRERFPNRKAA